MSEVENNEQIPENEETLTLSEIVKMEQDLQDDVYAVLGGSNDKSCSYVEGYVKRQALYACLTCIPEGKEDPTKRAGICLACSYHCHDGHELIELFTKRNFRCDCGNGKFGEKKCNLSPTKDDNNDLNIYNQNFSGVYCTCNRPYPDPEDLTNDEMIQCIICEDWYHTRHLDAKVPENYAEMICGHCIKNLSFILNYDGLAVTKIEPATTEASEATNVEVADENATAETVTNPESDVACSTACKKPKLSPNATACAKFFLEESWRQQLCTCDSCLKIYKEANVSFLIDTQDPVQFYEAKGNAKAVENEKEMQMKFLNELPRVPLLQTIAGFNDLKDQLSEYLKKFAENKKVVREEDIKEFFAGMDARKKQKLDYQYYCG